MRTRIDAALETFMAEEIEQLLGLHGELVPFLAQVQTSVRGGKRVRGAFCYWGWRATGQPDDDSVIRAAAAIELAHAAAIVHDDIIDGSDARRGGPSSHVALEALVKDPRHASVHATGLAILTGDLLMAWAGQLFLASGLPRAYLGRARALWFDLARELVAGECLEILSTHGEPGIDRALEIIRLKTAKYSIERPLHIGGTLGGASPGLLATFTAYGIPLGEAFQLRDDLLGVFGDPSQTGKSNMDDLRGGKPTALLAATMAAADETERKELDRLLGCPDLDRDGLDAVRQIMERTGARRRVETMIEERTEAARAAIASPLLSPDASTALARLVSPTAVREF
ncbi:polyprenyl synthetase family protein [Spirillospora sp. NPDC048911]|uniref:polyprenyl synthetase family protein n=1 Tax=Spirillospora sp. NPDC048911 TaxID=3364527 RepID=UPI003722EBFA